jgi:hypothetical protein
MNSRQAPMPVASPEIGETGAAGNYCSPEMWDLIT